MKQRRHLPAVALDDAAWLMECDPRALDGIAVNHHGRRVVALAELQRRGLTPLIARRRMAARTASAAPPPAQAAA